MNMKDTKKALSWIVGILNKHEVPFQISGGFAAKLHGSTRPLWDIDIDIPNEKFGDIMPDIETYLVSTPERFRNDNFDLLVMTLNYEGQEIDISGGDDIKIQDTQGEWHVNASDFSRYELKEAYGLTVPVIKKEDLIRYKKILNRPVDLEDIKQISE